MNPLGLGAVLDRVPRRAVDVAACVLFAVVVVRTAWLCDDAYITLRTLDLACDGHGLRYNVAERVQAYTHPLWALLLWPVFALVRDGYAAAMALSLPLAVATAAMLVRAAPDRGLALLAIAVAAGSRALVDFSTSGLENPLLHVLLIAFASEWLAGPARPARLGSIAALVALCRPDAALIVAPALVWTAVRQRRALVPIALGLSPLAAWAAFSLVYYGSALPNTAYAKLGTGVGAADSVRQGLWYLFHSLWSDPPTLAAIALALVVGLRRSARTALPLAVGIALYLAWVVRIGGDFMAGRFLSAPVVVALLLLLRAAPALPRPAVVRAAVVVALSTWIAPAVPYGTGVDFGADRSGLDLDRGIADERRLYYPATGLLRWRPGAVWPAHPLAAQGAADRAGGDPVVLAGPVGLRGYFGGAGIHYVDRFALVDPLLARLPALPLRSMRIGHFPRAPPDGYLDTLRSGQDRLADRRLAAWYADLAVVVRAPLWQPRRWRAIAALWAGSARPP